MKLVFFDLETGGTDHTIHPITQIAAIAVDEAWNEVETFERKLEVDVTLCDRKALEINGYDAEVWREHAILPLAAMNQFSRFLSVHADIERRSERTGNSYRVAQLVGYNAASFDWNFIQALFKKFNAFLPASYRVMDVYHLAMWHFHGDKSMESLKLEAVAEKFGVHVEKAHDALSDVRTTIEVCKAMRTKGSA